MKTKKDVVLSTRINEKFMDIVKQYAEKEKISTSKLLRNALTYYTRFIFGHEQSNNPIMLFSKSEIGYLLETSSNKQLEGFAEVCYQNGEKTKTYFINTYVEKNEGKSIKFGARFMIRILEEFVFSRHGQNWFEKHQISFSGRDRIIFAGVHNINFQFSTFFRYFMMKYLKPYGYDINREELTENKVVLEFQKQKE